MAARSSGFETISFRQTCLAAIVLRFLFMIYGEWQDANMVVKYTDIDYHVFTDAARHVAAGRSPYKRLTYRYTPILAILLVPNVTFHRAFGKLLFVFCDIFAGFLIYVIFKRQKVDEPSAVKYSWLWFFNPMIVTVSTRGNAESVLAVLVLSTLYFMVSLHFSLSAILLAFSVHFKIYPIIYALPLYLTVGLFAGEKQGQQASGCSRKQGLLRLTFCHLCHPKQLQYAFLSGSTFLVINFFMYYIYGFAFLEHSYLYHVIRKDVKHNFSIYFYMLYLTMDSPYSWIISLLTFLPQLSVVVAFGVKYYKELPFCCFLQTFAFVTFNKVCTSQYFLWYLSLLPLIVPRMQIKTVRALKMAAAWFLSQAFWLTSAYFLEFQGYNTLPLIWTASVVFFVVNIWILYTLISSHTYSAIDKEK